MLTVPFFFSRQVLVSDSTAGLLEEVLDQWDGPAESQNFGSREFEDIWNNSDMVITWYYGTMQ